MKIYMFFFHFYRLIIYDCDEFTYEYYLRKYSYEMDRNADYEALLNKVRPSSTLVKPPPHTITSVGTPEDSLQNCLSLQPKAPKRDLKKLLKYAGKVSIFLHNFEDKSFFFTKELLRNKSFMNIMNMSHLV